MKYLRRISFICWMPIFLLVLLMQGCPEEAKTFQSVSFPKDFKFGTALAQWQAEGDYTPEGPVDSNWSQWAQMGKTHNAINNSAGNGFYWKYEEDIALAKNLGLKVFRLGIDWSRIEPTPGVYSESELAHLEDVTRAIFEAGLEPVLTLYHWTVPVWVQNPNPASETGVVDLMATSNRDVVD
jgi:beta-glucosidase